MDDPTLLILWLLTWLAVVVMASRLILRKVRGQPFVMGDYLTMGALLCALVRLSLIHVVITWGTNNMSPKLRDSTTWTPEKIYQLSQVNRTTWASIELFVAAVAVNAPVLYTLRKGGQRMRPPPATVVELDNGPGSDTPMFPEPGPQRYDSKFTNPPVDGSTMRPETARLKR
ncbi:hypothetical protein SLS57_006075 [Botryosphaeria dothidea]